MRRQVRSLPNDETAWQIYGLREDGVFVLFSYYYFISFFFFLVYFTSRNEVDSIKRVDTAGVRRNLNKRKKRKEMKEANKKKNKSPF